MMLSLFFLVRALNIKLKNIHWLKYIPNASVENNTFYINCLTYFLKPSFVFQNINIFVKGLHN